MTIGKQALFLRDLIWAQMARLNTPLTVILNLTDRCNLKCAYCYAAYHDRHKRELTSEQTLRLLDELRALGCRRVSLAGGEPLLRDDLGEIIDHAASLGMMITVNSNGILVPEQLDLMRRADTLCISLDGDSAAHDVYRGKRSHVAAMQAIRFALKAGIQVMTNTVLTKRNLDQINWILDTARQYGFLTLFNVSIGLLSGKGDTFKAEDEDTRRALLRLIRLKREGAPILTSAKALQNCLDWPDYGHEFFIGETPDFPYIPCLAGRRFFTIDTNGDVYPCGHLMNGAFSPKNVLGVRLAEAVAWCGHHDCSACYHVSHNEFNLLFSADSSVLANSVGAGLRLHGERLKSFWAAKRRDNAEEGDAS